MSKRNKSGKTPTELARIYHRDILEEITPGSIYDSGISITEILHLPHMACTDDPCDALTEIMQDFDDEIDLTKILGRRIDDEGDICRALDGKECFIVKATSPCRDFTETIFNKEGTMDHHSGAGGRYIIWGHGPTLTEAYIAVVEMAVERVAKDIKKGLA